MLDIGGICPVFLFRKNTDLCGICGFSALYIYNLAENFIWHRVDDFLYSRYIRDVSDSCNLMLRIISHIISGCLVLRIMIENTLLIDVDTRANPVAVYILISINLGNHTILATIVYSYK